MPYEHKEGQGTLFRNTKKPEGSNQPDYRGELLINGVLLELAGWLKEGKSGKFLSLSAKPKEERPVLTTPRTISQADIDSDLPF